MIADHAGDPGGEIVTQAMNAQVDIPAGECLPQRDIVERPGPVQANSKGR